MISWSDIKNIVSDQIKRVTQLLLILVGAYAFIMAEHHARFKIVILFLGLFSWFFYRHKTKYSIVWLLLFILLMIDLFQSYFRVANHHFLMTFVVLSIILYEYHGSTVILQKNIQMLLFVVILTSAFQKLLSNQFIGGNFYYYMTNRAFVFDSFHRFFPEFLDIAKSNSERIMALQNTNPNNKESIILNDVFPNLGLISLIYARVTIALEVLVAVAILWKPKSSWTHLSLILMILGILCTRLEMGFMGILAICALFLCANYKLRLLYVLIAMVCITMVIARVGYH